MIRTLNIYAFHVSKKKAISKTYDNTRKNKNNFFKDFCS